jgi:glyoxylase-like metal-dependent hydrolase (beta-lactamase superfamily II)
VDIGPPAAQTNVPDLLRQGIFLAPQCVSAVDVSDDGKFVAVGTMAFRHDRNFWLLSEGGKILWGRYLRPWAPFQVAALQDARALAVGLAHSRVTAPFPSIAFFADENGKEAELEDVFGDQGWLRYGQGDWRTGWTVSMVGDLVVRSASSAFTPGAHRDTKDAGWQLTSDGRQEARPIGDRRPYRMALSASGEVLALGYIAVDARGLDSRTTSTVRPAPALLSVRSLTPSSDLWSAMPAEDVSPPPPLPRPADDFPELVADGFRLRPDAVVGFRAPASLALNRDGARVALTEYGGWMWVRNGPAVGVWDPPYRMIPFMPRQPGLLRIFGKAGEPLVAAQIPAEGLFDARLSPQGDAVWCIPASWFSRGMSGRAWRPADERADTIFLYETAVRAWTRALRFPDAVADAAAHPDGERLLVSCWDGTLYLIQREGKLLAKLAVGETARLKWSADGRFAIAGLESGEVLSVDAELKPRWRITLPVAPPKAVHPAPQPLVPGVPIYSVGRVGQEHAYVGDMWLIKTDQGAILVDAGGASAIPDSCQRLKALGIEPQDVRYLLITHTHGDHCGAAYLWRALGAKIVAPEPAVLTTTWLMPTLSDYGVWVPRPVDQPLPLKRAGDETEFTLCGVRIRAILVPGHSFDCVVYLLELNGKRIAFMGDIASEKGFIEKAWNDTAKGRRAMEVCRAKVLPFRPHHVFHGHRLYRDGMSFLQTAISATDEAILAEELFRRMDERLTTAQTLRLSFKLTAREVGVDAQGQEEGESRTEELAGTIALEEPNRARFEVQGRSQGRLERPHVVKGRAVDAIHVSDGNKLRRKAGPPPDRGFEAAAPKALRRAFCQTFARVGVYRPYFALLQPAKGKLPPVDPSDTDVVAQLTSLSFTVIRKDRSGKPEAIEYTVRPPEGGRIVSRVWVDPQTGLPGKRTTVIHGGRRQVTVNEEYLDLQLNAPIEPARFELPPLDRRGNK